MLRPHLGLKFIKMIQVVGLEVLCLIVISGNCFASELVILTSEKDEARNQQLQISIDAQLMDYDATSELIVNDDISSYDENAADSIRQIQQRTGRMAYLWLNDSHFYLYVYVAGDSHLFNRPLPDDSGSWEVRCDAIAANVQAMLSPWLSDNLDNTVDAVNGLTGAPPRLENSLPEKKRDLPAVTETGVDHREDESTRPIRPGVGAAFSTYLMSTNSLWSSGATLLFNLRFGSRLLLSNESGFAVNTNRSFQFLRVPIRLRAEIFWEMQSFWIGIGASFLIDATRVSSKTDSDIEKVGKVYIGTGASLSYVYNVNAIFSIFLRGGVDIYQSSNKYWHGDKLVFYYAQLQGRTLAGIIFWLR